MRPVVLVLAAGLVVLAGCGAASPGSTGSAARRQVAVLYAGSLTNLMERGLLPAVPGARGYAGGSQELANQVTGHLRVGDVFVSASPTVDESLRRAGALSWWVSFATAPLLLGYNPRGNFATDLRTKPWYDAVAEPGFRLGRTDPALDPKGRLSLTAARRVGASLSRAEVFPEETLVARLQAGQLDAAFLYANEAAERAIPTVSLAPATVGATYTVSVLAAAPHPAAGKRFVLFLLSTRGRQLLRRHGLTPRAPVGHGPVPAWVPAWVPTGARR